MALSDHHIIRQMFAPGAFISMLFFPWPLTILLTLVAALSDPIVPLAVGIFADVLYSTGQVLPLSHYSILGGVTTLFFYFIRSRLRLE